jgi:hypothetical protein
MNIHNHRFDMTDVFAQAKQRVTQANTVLQRIPPAQRQAVMEAMQTPATTPIPRSIDATLTTTAMPVRDWDGGSNAMPRTTVITRIGRPLRIRQPLPLAWRCWVAGVRLKRRINTRWQRQSRRLKRELRLLARQALRHCLRRMR